jgi:hypothetical protein
VEGLLSLMNAPPVPPATLPAKVEPVNEPALDLNIAHRTAVTVGVVVDKLTVDDGGAGALVGHAAAVGIGDIAR